MKSASFIIGYFREAKTVEVLPGTAEPLLQEGWSSRRDEHCGCGDCKRALDD